MIGSVAFGNDMSGAVSRIAIEFDRVCVEIRDREYARLLIDEIGVSVAPKVTDHAVRRWVGEATIDGFSELNGVHSVYLSDGRVLTIRPKPEMLGDLSLEEWITGILRLRRSRASSP
jgi:hypothetical protein